MSLRNNIYKKLKIKDDVNVKRYVSKPVFKRDKYIVLSNDMYQMDLIEMSMERNNKDEFKYVFVIINMRTRISDVEPMKNKTAIDALKAFKIIFDRRIITDIKYIYADNGSEFKNKIFLDFCDEKKIKIFWTRAGQHRHNTIVENINGLYKRYLYRYINYKYETIYDDKKPNHNLNEIRKFDDALYIIRDEINKKNSLIYPITPNLMEFRVDNIDHKFNIGDKVYVKLDYPINPNGTDKKIGDFFRHSDMKFSRKIYTITNINYGNNFKQLRYKVADSNGKDIYGSYTENELLRA